MVYPLTITSSAMRDINRSAILEIIRRESPISRTAIAQRLDVSLATVMRIVEELVDEGFVRLQGSTEWSGGRRRPLLEFNSDGYVVIGADLGGTKLYGAASDLGGNILDEISMDHHNSFGEECYGLLVGMIDHLLTSSKIEGKRVRGIGVGAPGITLHKEGIVTWAYTLRWQNFPLKSRLAERYTLPITVDNDVNLAALGELWFGEGLNCRNMILVNIGTGIGAGIIIDGSLYRGINEASGEVGSMVPGKEFLGKSYKDFGALESISSGTGIADRARKSRSRDEQLRAEDIFEAARKDQKWAVEIIDGAVEYLAIAIANLAVLFDPELIVLGGGLTRSADMLVEPILKLLDGLIPTPPRLVVSKLGTRATVMGAVTHVLHNTSNYYVVHKLS